ncbi:hypothetical protein GQN54_08695, partial [Cryomorphaceae bacterium S-15]|nr:hypothetical protein [Acidiluteibacter ferrifornacis]
NCAVLLIGFPIRLVNSAAGLGYTNTPFSAGMYLFFMPTGMPLPQGKS